MAQDEIDAKSESLSNLPADQMTAHSGSVNALLDHGGETAEPLSVEFGGRRIGKQFRSYLAFCASVNSGKKAIVFGLHYVVQSRIAFDEQQAQLTALRRLYRATQPCEVCAWPRPMEIEHNICECCGFQPALDDPGKWAAHWDGTWWAADESPPKLIQNLQVQLASLTTARDEAEKREQKWMIGFGMVCKSQAAAEAVRDEALKVLQNPEKWMKWCDIRVLGRCEAAEATILRLREYVQHKRDCLMAKDVDGQFYISIGGGLASLVKRDCTCGLATALDAETADKVYPENP